MRNSLFIIVAVFFASLIGGCATPCQNSCHGPQLPKTVGIYVMYVDDISDARCERVKERFFPLYEGNESHLDLISEAALKSGYTYKLEPIHIYLHPEDKPDNYVIIVYFCSEMKFGEGNTITFIPDGNWDAGYKFVIDNDENLWELYYRAFTEFPVGASRPEPRPRRSDDDDDDDDEDEDEASGDAETDADASGDAEVSTEDDEVEAAIDGSASASFGG